MCKECENGEVEDVEHWLLRCAAWKTLREPLLARAQEHQEGDHGKLAALLDILYSTVVLDHLIVRCRSVDWIMGFQNVYGMCNPILIAIVRCSIACFIEYLLI